MKTPEINTRKLMTIGAQGLVITVIVSSLVLLLTSSAETLQQMQSRLHGPTVPLLILPILLSWGCNGARFYLMCRCLGHRLAYPRAVAIAISSEFGMAASPGGVGGTAIRLAFLKKSGVPLVHGGALLAADMFMDILFFSLLLPFALYALLHDLRLDPSDFSSGKSPALWMVLLPALFLFFRKQLNQILLQHPVSKRYRLAVRLRMLRNKTQHGVRQSREACGLIFKNHRRILAVNVLLTALQFSSRYSILPLTLWMLGVEINPLSLVVMQGALYLVSMVMIIPGGGGSVEVLAALALPQLMPANLIGVAILLWRTFTYHFYLLAGGAVFLGTFKRLMKNP